MLLCSRRGAAWMAQLGVGDYVWRRVTVRMVCHRLQDEADEQPTRYVMTTRLRLS